jgi:hypothetical protein
MPQATRLCEALKKTRLSFFCFVASLALVGCGSSTVGTLKSPAVTLTCARAGISLTSMGALAGVDEFVDSEFVEAGDPSGPWLEVDVYPTTRLASQVEAVGGNITDGNGRRVPPLAVVRNVVVTRFMATPRQRRLTAVALRLLRRLR